MTFGVPYSFVPGTKAKADEVNANFIDVLTKIEDTNLRIDETNSNAVSNSAEVTTKFENVEASIDQRANLDLSNISTTGKALFDAKANTSDIDGQWIAKELTIVNNVKLANTGTITYSLADYLPKDNNIYEVMISFAGYFDKGQYSFNTSFYTVFGPYGRTRQVSGSITTPVGTAKELRLYPTSFCSGDNELTIKLNAYRKVR